MDGIILRSKRSASITVAGLALGSLLLAGSPAWAQTVSPPYVDQRGAYQQQQIRAGLRGGNTTIPDTDRREWAYQRADRQGK